MNMWNNKKKSTSYKNLTKYRLHFYVFSVIGVLCAKIYMAYTIVLLTIIKFEFLQNLKMQCSIHPRLADNRKHNSDDSHH